MPITTSPTKDDNVQTMRNSGQNFKDAAGNALNEAKHDLRDAANNAGQKVRHFVDTASDEISHASETVSARINEKPVQSSLIALGIGFVLGALLRR